VLQTQLFGLRPIPFKLGSSVFLLTLYIALSLPALPNTACGARFQLVSVTRCHLPGPFGITQAGRYFVSSSAVSNSTR